MYKYFVIFILLILILILLFYKNDNEKMIVDIIHKNTDIQVIKKGENILPNKIYLIVNDKKMFRKITLNGEIGFGESYMNGDWDSNNLDGLLVELRNNYEKLEKHVMKYSLSLLFMNFVGFIQNQMPSNTLESSPQNMKVAYDIGNNLFEKMLGKYMQYTCAYFHKPNMTLDDAQYAKMELIAKKLDLKPGMKVLDIGCGYGSMAQHLAKKYNVNVIGVTLSKEQKKYAEQKFKHPNVSIQLKDYRHINEKFDRVYSVGMFEHVGIKNHKVYFDKCYKLLNNNGIMLLHTIGTNNRELPKNSFVFKYIFPGVEIPNLQNLSEHIDKWHLEDLQNFGISYSKTLRNWNKNLGDWSGLDEYDIRFRRMWKLYLLMCAANFETRGVCLWQIVYTKLNSKRKDDLHHIRRC